MQNITNICSFLRRSITKVHIGRIFLTRDLHGPVVIQEADVISFINSDFPSTGTSMERRKFSNGIGLHQVFPSRYIY